MKALKLFRCHECHADFLSKYARKSHICGSGGAVYSDRVEALKAQREAKARQARVGAA